MKTIEYYFDMGRYEEAVPYIEKMFAEDPLDCDAFYYMAVVHMERGETGQARELCEQALLNGGDPAACYHFIGITFQEEKNFKEAEKAYLAALEEEPENGDYLATYGYLMLKAGFDEKALKLLEEAKYHDPTSETVNQMILQYYFAKSNQEEQLVYIQNVMETASSEVQNLVNLGLFHALKKEYHEAREFFRQAFLLDPTNQDLLEVLEDFDELTHPLFLPHRFMMKAGGPAVIYLGAIAVIFLLSFIRLYTFLLPFIVIYIVFCIYTWVTPFLYKRFLHGKI